MGQAPTRIIFFFFENFVLLCVSCVFSVVHVSKKKEKWIEVWVGDWLANPSFSRIFIFFQLDKTPKQLLLFCLCTERSRRSVSQHIRDVLNPVLY